MSRSVQFAKATDMTALMQPKVTGFVEGSLRSLSSPEAENLKFISHNNIFTWKGLAENMGQPDVQVHLMNTAQFEGHYEYTQGAIGRGATYSPRNFFDDIQIPARRRYMPFLVFDFRQRPLQWKGKSYQWVMNIRRYKYADTHQGLADMLADLRTLLSDRLMKGFGEPLLFVYETRGTFHRPHVVQISEVNAAGFATITESEMIEAAGGALVSVLNPGTAIGYLERVNVGESASSLTLRHIAVLEDTPERVPPVSGIITLEPQTPLSHINLLAKNRGTPNVSTARIELVPNLEALLGKLVKMVASTDGSVVIHEVSLAAAEQFWASRIREKLTVPAIRATTLLPVEFAADSGEALALPNIGSKASNYATLQRLLPKENVRAGFGLSFAHYQKIVAASGSDALIQELLSKKGVLSPEEINTQLEGIRDRIRKETTKETVADTLNAVRAVIEKMPGVPRIRLRSSTNSEDLPTFNGAGLYESAGFNVEDSDKKLRKKLLRVMASLWLERAFWERELFGIDHSAVGMAVLINPAFSDEYANGVVIGSAEPAGFRTWVNAQKGEASVTNPLDDEISESFTFFGNRIGNVQVQSRSNIGNVFLENGSDSVKGDVSAHLVALKQITQQLHDHFVARQRDLGDRHKYGIDIEYKLMKEEQIALYIKQSRLLNLDHEAARPNDSIRKVVAKDNGMDGGHLRRRPLQLSALDASEFCVMKTDSVIGINAFEEIGNGFVKVNVTVTSSSCPDFRGEMYLFKQHFNFI